MDLDTFTEPNENKVMSVYDDPLSTSTVLTLRKY
jgi:hypothetical protein